ncbi:MAG: hypothetical protein FJX46_02200 [Alphaproteobacteria bacterium]|nr:hypothetical protein [Alphaproteobacteria bacterium]
MAKKHEIIEPPNKLSDRVSKGGPNPMDAIAKAEAKLQEMAKDYGQWLENDLEQVYAALAKARAGGAERAAHVKALHGAAFNIKGQAGTFGKPLLSRISKSLCKLIEERAEFTDEDLTVAATHVDALKAAAAGQYPDKLGEQVAMGLEGIVSKRLTA